MKITDTCEYRQIMMLIKDMHANYYFMEDDSCEPDHELARSTTRQLISSVSCGAYLSDNIEMKLKV